MADGTNADPIIIDPSTFEVTVKLLRNIFTGRDDYDVTELIEDLSPVIRSAVSPGECFAFKTRAATVFLLKQDEYGELYFVRWPGLHGFPKFYLDRDAKDRPWLQDRINELKRRVREMNPFTTIDKIME